MASVKNRLTEANTGIELNELEVVTAPLVTKGFEETIFSTEIIKGNPEHWDGAKKVDRNAQLYCMATSPDGLVIAVAREGGIIHITDKITGAELKTVKASDKQINCLAFNPKTSMLYAGTEDGKIYVVFSTSTITNTLEGHTSWVSDLAGETVDILEENSTSCLPNVTTLCASL